MSLAYDATLRHGDRRSLDAGDVYSEAGFELVNAGDFPFGSYGTQASEFPGSTALFNDNDEGVTVLRAPLATCFTSSPSISPNSLSVRRSTMP